MDIAVADFNGDDVLDIVTAEKGAPNFLYLGLGKTDPTKLGDFSGVRQCEPPQIVGALLPRIFQSEGALDRATGFVLLPSLIIRQQRLELIFAQRLCDAFGGMCRSN